MSSHATRRSTWAAPLGVRLPCSQWCRVLKKSFEPRTTRNRRKIQTVPPEAFRVRVFRVFRGMLGFLERVGKGSSRIMTYYCCLPALRRRFPLRRKSLRWACGSLDPIGAACSRNSSNRELREIREKSRPFPRKLSAFACFAMLSRKVLLF